MAIGETIKETWFIAVLAGIGGLILILVIIIIVLCCLWVRRKKQDKKKEQEADRKSSTPSSYQEMPDAQNWTLVQQNGIHSVPASTDTPRQINGDDPYIAGSSMIKMNQEMQKNGSVHTSHTQIETHTQTHGKTGVEKTLQQNSNIDAFERKISDTSEASRGAWRGVAASPAHFDRTSDVRESSRSSQSYQKPRITNVQISRSIQHDSQARASYPSNDRIYLPERSESFRATHSTVYNQSTQPYRLPKEDYLGIEMYNEEEMHSWKTPAPSQQNSINRLLSDGKVKNLTEKFETTEVNSGSAATPSRNAQETELREQITEWRGNKRPQSFPMSPQRTSQEYSVQQDYQGRGGQLNNWQGKSGKGTIETRVNRIKKLGAVSVFPD